MDMMFSDNFQNCLKNLRANNYRGATSELYPIFKKTDTLAQASASDAESFVKSIASVTNEVCGKLQELDSTGGAENYRHLLTDVYRILRNSCGVSPKVREMMCSPNIRPLTEMFENTRVLSDAVRKLYRGESQVQVLAVIIQFIHNLAGDVKNQDVVWDQFRHKLRTWLAMVDEETDLDQELMIKIINYSCAVVEVCLPRQWQRWNNAQSCFLNDDASRDICKSVIHAATCFSFEFGKKAMLKIIQIPNLFERVYLELSYPEKYVVCDCLKEVITEWRNNGENPSDTPTVESNLVFLANNVIVARPLLKAELLACRTAVEKPDLHHHVKMLEMLSVASSCRALAQYLSNLKLARDDGPTTLMEYAIGFLKDAHLEGKKGFNCLSMVRDKKEVDESHPAYHLRCDLVRLIGNLAYNNKAMQDLVREYSGMSGLPVILEHTVIDERNPFLGEWAKLALSYLVRDNEENALFIHNLSQKTDLNASGILRSCGLVLEKEGNRIKIRAEGPQPSLKKLLEKTSPRP